MSSNNAMEGEEVTPHGGLTLSETNLKVERMESIVEQLQEDFYAIDDERREIQKLLMEVEPLNYDQNRVRTLFKMLGIRFRLFVVSKKTIEILDKIENVESQKKLLKQQLESLGSS